MIATELEAHSIANLFPMIAGQELEELSYDIRANGLLEPIVLHEGKILDGRNRYAACELAGVEPHFVEWSGQGVTPVRFVLSHNLHRRHLTTSQRAAIAVEVLPMFEEEARHRQGARTDLSPDLGKGVAVHASREAAALMAVGKTSVENAKAVKLADPEEFERIKRGEVAVDGAYAKVKARNAAPPAQEPPRSKAGSRIAVPEGKTVEGLVREGLALEETGAPSDEVADAIGMNGRTYRVARYIVLLADRQDLSARDAATVVEALATLNNRTVTPAFEMVEALVTRIYGASAKTSPARSESVRRANFDRAYGTLIQACAAAPLIEVPFLSPDDIESFCAELKAAAQHLHDLRRRLKEENE